MKKNTLMNRRDFILMVRKILLFNWSVVLMSIRVSFDTDNKINSLQSSFALKALNKYWHEIRCKIHCNSFITLTKEKMQEFYWHREPNTDAFEDSSPRIEQNWKLEQRKRYKMFPSSGIFEFQFSKNFLIKNVSQLENLK